jgi:hypothetical protein
LILWLRIEDHPFVVRLASLGKFHCFGFVFELIHGAFLLVEVTAEAQENRLEEASAFLEGIQAPNFHYGTDWWNGLVHRNSDLASRNPTLLFMEQTYFHAPFFIDSTDNGGNGSVEFVFELIATCGRSPRCVGAENSFEDHAFGFGQAFQHGLLAFPAERGIDPMDEVGPVGINEVTQGLPPLDIGQGPHVFAVERQKIERIEMVPYAFAVDNEISGDIPSTSEDGFWEPDGESFPVDAYYYVSHLLD